MNATTSIDAGPPRQQIRGLQLLFGVIATMAVSSPQYVWALFVPPVRAALGVSLAQVQITIAIFSVCMCGLAPLHGLLAQHVRRGALVAAGGALSGAGWVLCAHVNSLTELYLAYGVLCGLGVGMVYVAGTDLASEWFPDRRGLAVGLVAAGYSIGAVVTTFPIDATIRSSGFRHALVIYGLVLGAICILAAAGMRERAVTQPAPSPPAGTVRSYTPRQMLREPGYWLLFAIMTFVGTGGLMIISQIAVFARDFGIGPHVMVLGVAALPLALTLDRAANGITRPLFGWISDHIGRENAMALAFAIEGCSILLLMLAGGQPALFVTLSAVVFLGWGEIFSLLPATQADMFGPKHQAINLGLLLTSIAVASVFGGPLASLIYEHTGSWSAVFVTVSCLDLFAAGLSLWVLAPMRRARMHGYDPGH